METINIGEIISDIEANGIKVIPTGYAKSNSADLKGNLDSFIATAKAFNENVIFMSEFSFDNESFFHEPHGAILGEYDEPASEDGINLTQFSPELEDYKSYIGQTSFIIFRVFYKNHTFDYYHYAEWFDAFNKSLEEAERIFEEKEKVIKDQRAQEENATRKEAEQREGFLRGLLEELGDDAKFASLPTQKAKQEYALARYPELNEFSPNLLKVEISNLIARIQAKKILQ